MALNGLKPGFLPVLKSHKGLIAAAFTLMVFSGFGQSVFFGIYLKEIELRFSLDKTSVGSIYAAATVLSAILMAWSGKFLDTAPLSRFVSIILCGLALGCLFMGLATHPIMLFFAFLFLRQFGQGLMVLSGTTAINRYIENGRGRAQSMAQTGLPIHAALFPILGIIILEHLGYTQSWLLYTSFIVLVLIPFFFVLLRNHEVKTHQDWRAKIDEQEKNSDAQLLPDQWTRNAVLKDWRFYMIMTIMVIPPCFGTAVFFFQSAIADNIDISQATFASGFIFMTAASVIGSLLAGVLIDKYGEHIVLMSFPVFYASGLILLAQSQGLIILYAGLISLGFGGGMMAITGGPLFAKMYGTKHYASIKSLSVIAMILASAVSPPLTGYLLDINIGIDKILIYFAGYAFISWAFMTFSIRKILRNEADHDTKNA